MEPVAQELKKKLQSYALDPTNDSALIRTTQFMSSAVQDIENQLKNLQNLEPR